jgi:threonyl-tRNA synthetase
LYLLFNDFEEQGLPVWLQPVQVRLLPVGAAFVDVSLKLAEQYADLPLRIEVDDRSMSLSAKLKSAHEDLVPHKIAIGQKEIDGNFAEFEILIQKLVKEVEGKPFIRREWPMEISKNIS